MMAEFHHSNGGHSLTLWGQWNILMESSASPASEIKAAFIITCPVGMTGLLICAVHTSSEVKTMEVIL